MSTRAPARAPARTRPRWRFPYGGPGKFEPFPRQALAHRTFADEVLFGGAAGGGKSDWLIGEHVTHALEVPGSASVLFRRSFPDLNRPQGIIRRLLDRLPPSVATYNMTEHIWTFRNGSLLELAHLERDSDVLKYQGSEYTLVGFDELTQFSEWQYLYMMSRQRAAGELRSRLEAKALRPRTIASSNPGGPGHCVPEGEVLTPQGWRDIRGFQVGDPVYGVTPVGALVESVVEQVHRHRAAELVDITARGLRITATPEHRVAKVGGTRGSPGSAFSLVALEDLPGQATIARAVAWDGKALPSFSPPPVSTRRRRLRQPATLPGGTFAAVLGWMLAEGSTVDRDKAFVIAQSKPDHRVTLKRLLEDEAGFTVSWSAAGATVYAPDWWAYFRQLGKCRDKYVPRWVLHGDQADLRRLFDALMDGDGHREGPHSGTFYTTSECLAGDFAEAAVKLGYIVFTSRRQRNRVGWSYAVSYKRTRSGGTEVLTGNHLYDVATETTRRSRVVRRKADEEVYCIGLREGAFVLRQRGSVWVSGNSWVKARFIDPAPPFVVWRPDPTIEDLEPGTRCFIPARLEDNPALDAGYEARLNRLPEDERRALREGDWDVFAGQRFKEFRRAIHVIEPEDYPIPLGGVTRGCAVDYGLDAPFCALWGVKGPDGLIVVYRELYEAGLTPKEQARKLLGAESRGERTPQRPIPVAIDPATWARQPGEVKDKGTRTRPPKGSIAGIYRKEGVPVVRANNDRLLGVAAVAGKLRVRPDGRPRLLIYSNCTNLIRTLPTLVRDPRRPEDVDTTGEDHAYDTLRYLIALLERSPSGDDPSRPPDGGGPKRPRFPTHRDRAEADRDPHAGRGRTLSGALRRHDF